MPIFRLRFNDPNSLQRVEPHPAKPYKRKKEAEFEKEQAEVDEVHPDDDVAKQPPEVTPRLTSGSASEGELDDGGRKKKKKFVKSRDSMVVNHDKVTKSRRDLFAHPKEVVPKHDPAKPEATNAPVAPRPNFQGHKPLGGESRQNLARGSSGSAGAATAGLGSSQDGSVDRPVSTSTHGGATPAGGSRGDDRDSSYSAATRAASGAAKGEMQDRPDGNSPPRRGAGANVGRSEPVQASVPGTVE